jgi:hypothetical protein
MSKKLSISYLQLAGNGMLIFYIAPTVINLVYGVNGAIPTRTTVSHQSKLSGLMGRKSILKQHVGIVNQVRLSCCISTAEGICAVQLQRRI